MTSQVLEALRGAGARAGRQEACGLLLGKGEQVSEFFEVANVHPEPEAYFEIDPKALIEAYKIEREGGARLLGYFHSHPRGPARPSEIDAAMAAGDGKIWAILGEDEIGFWRSTPEGFAALSYSVIDQ